MKIRWQSAPLAQTMTLLEKRLLALGQLGAYLYGRDGHIYIECDTDLEGTTLADILRVGGVLFNNKIYGGVLEALETIDAALHIAGEPNLAKTYDLLDDILSLCAGGIGKSRIKIVKRGEGGLC